MTKPAPGMDHDLYRYSPLPERPKLTWPNGERLAFFVLLHLEYWELEPPEGSHLDPRFKGPRGDFFPTTAISRSANTATVSVSFGSSICSTNTG